MLDSFNRLSINFTIPFPFHICASILFSLGNVPKLVLNDYLFSHLNEIFNLLCIETLQKKLMLPLLCWSIQLRSSQSSLIVSVSNFAMADSNTKPSLLGLLELLVLPQLLGPLALLECKRQVTNNMPKSKINDGCIDSKSKLQQVLVQITTIQINLRGLLNYLYIFIGSSLFRVQFLVSFYALCIKIRQMIYGQLPNKSPERRNRNIIKTVNLVPLYHMTCRQLNQTHIQYDDIFYKSLNIEKVLLIGQSIKIEKANSHRGIAMVNVKMQDTTGICTVSFYFDEQMLNLPIGAYIKLAATVKVGGLVYRPEIKIMGISIVLLQNFNQLSHHHLECIKTYLQTQS